MGKKRVKPFVYGPVNNIKAVRNFSKKTKRNKTERNGNEIPVMSGSFKHYYSKYNGKSGITNKRKIRKGESAGLIDKIKNKIGSSYG